MVMGSLFCPVLTPQQKGSYFYSKSVILSCRFLELSIWRWSMSMAENVENESKRPSIKGNKMKLVLGLWLHGWHMLLQISSLLVITLFMVEINLFFFLRKWYETESEFNIWGQYSKTFPLYNIAFGSNFKKYF